MTLNPLVFEPIYKEKVWGGRAFERLGRTLPGDASVKLGESWEMVDLAQTSASGGGGGAERSIVSKGPDSGRSLAELIAEHGEKVLGGLNLSPEGGFPLLVKYLDADTNLSVQVHPSEAYAAEHDDAFLKSESWYIVDRQPGAVIYKGMKEGVTPQQLREALAQNTDEAVVPLMEAVPVEPGDIHYLPSGTCHALGGGILVAEVQTPSDTTFRVYDWGRTGRELHVDQAVQCIDFGPSQGGAFEPMTTTTVDGCVTTQLVACDYFNLARHVCDAGFEDTIRAGEPSVWMALNGSIQAGAIPIQAGETALIPASCAAESWRCESAVTLLEVTFPGSASGGALA